VVRVGQESPDFELDGTQGRMRLSKLRGNWVALFFYTKDYSKVCPSEVLRFNALLPEFEKLSAKVVGVSADSLESHQKWAQELGLKFSLLSDAGGEVSRRYEVFIEARGTDHRGTFLIDPEGKVRFLAIQEPPVARSVSEVLRVLKALQTGELCPADWQPGQPTLGRPG
jgi:alkyl hydroperoxide reductase subunit AhpC